ncbi:hypothetical protein VP395_15140 [Mariniflexile soesokkakense]|uniref:Uncharacterized protein n=1 Tax=Mariniflexile soesokkakense TaxID=1343160 RepID=A0ABV0ADA8_9FLAO
MTFYKEDYLVTYGSVSIDVLLNIYISYWLETTAPIAKGKKYQY